MKETLCPRCGETVVFQDMGDHPSFLTGECEGCHLMGEYLEGQGFTWKNHSERGDRLERARKALKKAIASEQAKYNPCINLINAYTDGLEALEGIK